MEPLSLKLSEVMLRTTGYSQYWTCLCVCVCGERGCCLRFPYISMIPERFRSSTSGCSPPLLIAMCCCFFLMFPLKSIPFLSFEPNQSSVSFVLTTCSFSLSKFPIWNSLVNLLSSSLLRQYLFLGRYLFYDIYRSLSLFSLVHRSLSYLSSWCVSEFGS